MFPEPPASFYESFKTGHQHHSVEVEEPKLPPPLFSNLTWNDMILREEITRGVRECGFERPSEVQGYAIPELLNGHDVLCQAKSGMGKTGVFVIAALNMLCGTNEAYQPLQCLVMAHTREMAHQIAKEFLRIGKYLSHPPFRLGCYYGGISVQDNLAELRSPYIIPHIVVGTPGRLLDLTERKGAPDLFHVVVW